MAKLKNGKAKAIREAEKLEREIAEREKRLKELQQELALIQQAYLLQGRNAIVVLEGVDAAGKGGFIRRVAWATDPRGLRVWPISAPSGVEAKQHYLQRFWSRAPEKGTIAVFDRSWYGRVLVERVEGFATCEEWERAYGEINAMEREWSDGGIRVVKFLLKISKDEQARRFLDRIETPRKHWKLTYEDFRNRDRWDEYEEAYKDMLKRTDKKGARWKVIGTDHKHIARIEAMEHLVKALGKGVDYGPPKPSREVRKLARKLKKEID